MSWSITLSKISAKRRRISSAWASDRCNLSSTSPRPGTTELHNGPLANLTPRIVTVHGMNYLLTGNCRHIANAEIMRGLVEAAEDLAMNYPPFARRNN